MMILALVTCFARGLSGAPEQHERLQCGQLQVLWNWSQAHYGGRQNPQTPQNSMTSNVLSDAFARSVAEQFLNQLDRHRYMLSLSEEKDFVKGAPEGFRQAFLNGDCRYFQTFASTTWESARSRAELHWDGIVLAQPKLTAEKLDENSSVETELPKFATRPSGGREFAQRLSEVAHVLSLGASPHLLKAYGSNRKAMALDILRDNYWDDDVAVRTPSLIAKSMLSALDKYSTFYSGEEFEDFYQELAGTVTGIGVQVAKVPNGVLVEKVMRKSPAERQGIRPGDLILEINGESVRSGKSEIARRLLKGPEYSALRLTLRRNNGPGVREIKIERSVFSAQENRVSAKWVAGTGGIPSLRITIPSFYGSGGIGGRRGENGEKSAAEDVEEILRRYAKKKGFNGPVILDLRGNPGGYLEEAVAMAGLFLGDKVVVGVEEKNERRILKGGRPHPLYYGPLAVWMDKESASAAEVLSGALKDHGRALVVGDAASYGKGSVQRLFHLREDAAYFSAGARHTGAEVMPGGVAKLTTSYFFSPLGHNPSNGGVVPHILFRGIPQVSVRNKVARKAVPSQIDDTAPFVPQGEVKRLRRRDSEIRTFVSQVQAIANASSADDRVVEEKIARFATQFAQVESESL